MAKQKKEKFKAKNIKINEEELSITKIGELETAEQSPLFILVLFGILLAFIFCLPTIVDFIKDPDDKPDYSLNQTQNKVEKNKEENEKNTNTIPSLIRDTLTIHLEENIQLEEFSLRGNTLSFKATNLSENDFDFHKNHYFLELYSKEDTLLARIFLEKMISKKTNQVLEISIANNVAYDLEKILFIKKETTDYPNVTLEKKDNQEEILVCTNENETLTYKFQNEKLYFISHFVSYNSTTNDYANQLQEWQSLSETLNNRVGINSMFVEATNNFIVNTTLDLKNVNLVSTDSVYYYGNETLAKIVKFEMDARGFQCK